MSGSVLESQGSMVCRSLNSTQKAKGRSQDQIVPVEPVCLRCFKGFQKWRHVYTAVTHWLFLSPDGMSGSMSGSMSGWRRATVEASRRSFNGSSVGPWHRKIWKGWDGWDNGFFHVFSPVVNGFNMFQPLAFYRSMTSLVTSASIQVINGHNPKFGRGMLNIESAWLIWTLIHSNVLLFNADFLILFDFVWCVMMCPSNLRAARSIRPRGGSIDRCQAGSVRPMPRHVCRSSTPLFLSRRRPMTEITMDIATKYIKIYDQMGHL